MAEVKPSYIDGILSTHFNECSIAAADACLTAETEYDADARKATRSVQPIGHFMTDGLMDFEFSSLETIKFEHPLVADGSVELALATHPEHPIPLSLVAIFNKDAMLPLATFERRSGGQCSYVQLGQEIEEDNLVVTPDEPRSAYVESIRTFLQADVTADELLKKHIAHELDTYKDHIESVLPAAVNRLTWEYYNTTGPYGSEELHNTKLRELTILNDNLDPSTTEPEDFFGKKLTFVSPENEEDTLDGRKVSLYLARRLRVDVTETPGARKFLGRRKSPQKTVNVFGDGNLYLLAVVRGGVALKLLEFSEDGLITEDGLDKYTDPQTLAYLLQTLPVKNEYARQAIVSVREKYQWYERLYVNGKDFSPTKPRYYDGDDFGHGKYASFSAMRNAVAKYYEKQTIIGGEVAALIDLTDKPLVDLLAHLEVKQRFNSYLGRGNTKVEQLVTELGSLVLGGNKRYTGILHKKKAGNTVTDVDTEVFLSNGNKRVRVVVKVRPKALEDDEHAVYFDETLRMDARNSIPADKLKELSEVIGTICLNN